MICCHSMNNTKQEKNDFRHNDDAYIFMCDFVFSCLHYYIAWENYSCAYTNNLGIIKTATSKHKTVTFYSRTQREGNLFNP